MKFYRVIACAFLSLACSSALAQPVLRYTFDEASGNALDSGQAPLTDATFEGGAIRSTDTPSGSGSSLDLRTESPYAHLLGPNATDLNGLTALTITTWLNVETYTSGNHRLLSQQAATTFGGFSFNMNATPNVGTVGPDNFRIGMFIGNNISSGATDFGAAFSDADVDAANKWIMLAVTYDSSLATDNTKFYIGGVSTAVAQLGTNKTLPQLTMDAGAARVGVGFTDAAPAANTSVLGRQDDIRAYATALDRAALDAVRLENLPTGGFLDGDFDEDGDVDGGDFLIWQRGGSPNPLSASDLADWQANYGVGPLVATSFAVPEPASAVLLILAAAGWCRRRRRTA